jgi:hypothetical protein
MRIDPGVPKGVPILPVAPVIAPSATPPPPGATVSIVTSAATGGVTIDQPAPGT